MLVSTRVELFSRRLRRLLEFVLKTAAVCVSITFGTALALYSPDAVAVDVKLAWDASTPSSNVGGYRVHYGLSSGIPSGIYPNKVFVGNQTNYTLSGLISGKTYYIAVTAHAAIGFDESAFSNEVSVTIAPDSDNDDDGLPNTFESANGLDPLDPSDAGADPDGDTFSTLDEFLAGSDPFDAGSTPLSIGDAFVQDELTGFWHSYAYFDNASWRQRPRVGHLQPRVRPGRRHRERRLRRRGRLPRSAERQRRAHGHRHGRSSRGVGRKVSPPLYYQLDIGKTVLAGVVTSSSGGDDFPTLDLTIGEGVGYQQGDLTGTWYRYRYSDSEGFTSAPRWTTGRVAFDATGLIIGSDVFASTAPGTPLAPWTGSATLAVDGEVLPAGNWVSSDTAFSLSMDAGKSVVVGVATRNASGTVFQDHQLWVKQGSAYAQGDMAGTWYVYGFADTSSGTQIPAWTRHTLVVDAAGTVVDGSGVDSAGVLQPHGGTLTLAADGRVTLSGGLATGLVFQELRMDAGRTVIGGVLSGDLAGEPFERLVVAVKSGSARPEILSPVPGSVLPGASATWKWTDNGNLVTEWWLTVGTSVGGSDLYNSGSLAAVTRDHTVSGLPTAGGTVFVRLLFREAGVWLSSDVQYTAFTGTGPGPTPPPPPGPTPPPPAPAPAPTPTPAPRLSPRRIRETTAPSLTSGASASQGGSERDHLGTGSVHLGLDRHGPRHLVHGGYRRTAACRPVDRRMEHPTTIEHDPSRHRLGGRGRGAPGHGARSRPATTARSGEPAAGAGCRDPRGTDGHGGDANRDGAHASRWLRLSDRLRVFGIPACGLDSDNDPGRAGHLGPAHGRYPHRFGRHRGD